MEPGEFHYTKEINFKDKSASVVDEGKGEERKSIDLGN
jgi:hypothetical protein